MAASLLVGVPRSTPPRRSLRCLRLGRPARSGLAGRAPMTSLRVDVGQDGVALILYDVPGEPVNTLRDTFQEDFEKAFSKIAEDGAVKAVVLASAKPDSFVVGADVEMLARIKTAAEATALARGGQQAMQKLEELGKRKPIVAAIHGPALRGRLELALACTYRIATDSTKTH